MSKGKMIGIAVAVVLVGGIVAWASTAPYLSNQGLGRTPGIILGGTPTPPLDDFTVLNGAVQGPLMKKHVGFPPFVDYLSWVATPDGIITATRPDNGYWERRVRERGGEGWLRIGDATFAMEAHEITDARRLPMMSQWAAKAGRTLDDALYAGSEPLREWKVFFWTPREE